MHKLISSTLLFLTFFSASKVYSVEISCFEEQEIKIEIIVPRIHFESDKQRKDRISVKQLVNCKTKKIVIPVNHEEALKRLDFSLPLDFKVGMIAGDYLNVFKYTRYGVSVENDLFDYFTKNWNLTESSKLCKLAKSSDKAMDVVSGCFFRLMDELRGAYKFSAKG